jgi:hypothetical protein
MSRILHFALIAVALAVWSGARSETSSDTANPGGAIFLGDQKQDERKPVEFAPATSSETVNVSEQLHQEIAIWRIKDVIWEFGAPIVAVLVICLILVLGRFRSEDRSKS